MSQMFAFASTALQVIGDITAGNNADKAATYNATVLNQQADTVNRVYGQREEVTRQRNRAALANQQAAMLANGVDPASGSALIGSEQQARDAELDALNVRYEGLLQARDLRTQAALTSWEGKARKQQGYLSAAGRLVGAAGSYLSGSGWGKNGPGFSGTQAPAPVKDLSFAAGPM